MYIAFFAIFLLSRLTEVHAAPDAISIDNFGTISPKLKQFVKQHRSAWQNLTNVLSEAFSVQKFDLYYYYSTDPTEPGAFHTYLSKFVVGIYIQENQPPIDEYFSLIYEARNSMGRKGFLNLFDRAKSNTISRTDFVKAVLKLEFDATKYTRDVLKSMNISQRELRKSAGCESLLKVPDDFEQFLKFITPADQASFNPFKHYEQIYDSLQTEPPTTDSNIQIK